MAAEGEGAIVGGKIDDMRKSIDDLHTRYEKYTKFVLNLNFH